MKKQITANQAPPTKGFPLSHAIEANGMLYTSGQIYLTTDMELVEGSVEDKTHQVMKNLQSILEAGGVTFNHVVKATIYVTDMAIYGKVNEVYATYFDEPYPAREVVCVKSLPLGAGIEISMVAVKD